MLLAAGAALGFLAPRDALDWQPALAWREPWRAFSAAFVHWSGLHLLANLAGTAAVAALGVAAALPWRATAAWAAAWPATHLALLLRPDLMRYGGLSGVLHAGVAVAGVWVLLGGGPRRWVGALLLAGLSAKVLLESPWGPPLRAAEGWDILLAPVAHATGAVAGLACALVAAARRRGG